MLVKIATDGSHHEGKFGWAYAVVKEDGTVIGTGYGSGLVDESWAHGWNVAAECTAVVRALEAIKPEIEVEILHDYEGLGRWARGEWKAKKPCAVGYCAELKKLARKVVFTWVRGHDGHDLNETVDSLAYKALKEQPVSPVIERMAK